MTRSATRSSSKPDPHTLNFFYDDEDGCALTTLVKGFRFHIIADSAKLMGKSSEEQNLSAKYRALVSAVRQQEQGENDPEVCRLSKKSDDAGAHGAADSQDSGVGESFDDDSRQEDDTDSAVDVNEIDTDQSNNLTKEESEDPDKALQEWLLAPFANIFAELEQPLDDEVGKQSLAEWYSGPTYFYDLEIQDEELKPVELEPNDELETRIKNLVPHAHVPKWITDMGVPWFKAEDLTVITESEEPDPYHPSRVQHGDEVHFLKLVDTDQPQPLKRELKMLKEIENKGLHKKFRVPLVKGLVGYKDSKHEIVGFLLTDIEDPTPLTLMLDSDVIEDKREKWAKETQRIVHILHENNFVWGDAKADNFMVDKHGELWIIDFGGSYTDGWVDPELMETREGDEMGTKKIVNALKDPEANTYNPGEAEQDVDKDATLKERSHSLKKRPRDIDDNDEADETSSSSHKRRKSG